MKECCICGCGFAEYGSDPHPFEGEKCCDDCNDRFVIPARIMLQPGQREVIDFLTRFAQIGRSMVALHSDPKLHEEIRRDLTARIESST
jgi:hypothetical protein